ncbi:MAG: L-threonylcarbamoyladenylate synthase [Polyangia bacterium]|jgi:L-threonylcarbamoyladenylate synthase|nr:L-threonylcarbamoyladenylate synthase [Polyangia bacterium]
MRFLSPDPVGLAEAASILSRGGLVLYPTESFYGAAALALHEGAVDRLRELKGRPADMPLPLILPNIQSLELVVEAVPRAAQELIERYWPGPLTIVLFAKEGLPSAIIGSRGVGVRLSPHPVATGLALEVGAPITATSANRAGEPPPRDAVSASLALPGADAVLDGGEVQGGLPSTVLAVAQDGGLTLLRQGAADVGLA